ncbi:hypothetical protein AHAS_Ahas15G0344700 [Arachis hypogaea]
MQERLKDKLKEFFNCQYELFIIHHSNQDSQPMSIMPMTGVSLYSFTITTCFFFSGCSDVLLTSVTFILLMRYIQLCSFLACPYLLGLDIAWGERNDNTLYFIFKRFDDWSLEAIGLLLFSNIASGIKDTT